MTKPPTAAPTSQVQDLLRRTRISIGSHQWHHDHLIICMNHHDQHRQQHLDAFHQEAIYHLCHMMRSSAIPSTTPHPTPPHHAQCPPPSCPVPTPILPLLLINGPTTPVDIYMIFANSGYIKYLLIPDTVPKVRMH